MPAAPVSMQLRELRDRQIVQLHIVMRTIVSEPEEQPNERTISALRESLNAWKQFSQAIESSRNYWEENLPDETREHYKRAQYFLNIIERLYGPQAVERG